ncbi:MAG: capsule biosynthesis protein CapK [Thermoanaerobaculia bacterium]
MTASPHLTDDERFPLIPESSRGLLARLREHEAAPRYNMACGDRLTGEGLRRVRAFEESLVRPVWNEGEVPAWVREFAATALLQVPIYRKRGGRADAFEALPTSTRADIAREPWSFVPDDQPLDDLIVYYTAGASGTPMNVLAHPEAAAKRLPLFRAALRERGVSLDGGLDRVSIAFVCSQRTTLTYASLSSVLGGAGHVKVNLNPGEWRHPDDRARFLDDCAPEIYTGDPLSFADLAALPQTTRPRALISSALALLPALRARLEARFACPVIDLYSLCESGPIGVSHGEGFRVLPSDLFVEVLDGDGTSVAPGKRGEVTLTGGRNPFLPLLRYRTGDWARLEHRADGVYLLDLEGRAPVVFRAVDGRAINNIDVTTVLRPFALARFAVHQQGDSSLRVRLNSGDDIAPVAAALRSIFGTDQAIAFESFEPGEWKVVPYATP